MFTWIGRICTFPLISPHCFDNPNYDVSTKRKIRVSASMSCVSLTASHEDIYAGRQRSLNLFHIK